MFKDLIKKKKKYVLGYPKTVYEENQETMKKLQEAKRAKDYIFGKGK